MGKFIAFVRAVLKHWGALVTGGAVIGVIGIWQGTGHTVRPSVYWVIGIAALFVAFFKAWEDQRQAKEAAVAGASRPLIKGEIVAAFWDFLKRDSSERISLLGSRLYLCAKLVNHHDAPTTLDRYVLHVDDGGKLYSAVGNPSFGLGGKLEHTSPYADDATLTTEWGKVTSVVPMRMKIHSASPLKRAIQQEGWIEFIFPDMPAHDDSTWKSDLRLEAIDSLGGSHSIFKSGMNIYQGEMRLPP